MKLDAQVDMIEFKEYGEIDLDETPVIALACGHFFTAETLDGMIGLKEVYRIDPATGNILSLEDISSKMAPAIPKCPHCQRPIRQYATQRYNRLINRAVIDEMSKRFIVTGQTDLQEIEEKLIKVETELEDTRSDVTMANIGSILTDARDRAIKDVARKLQTRYKASAQLRSAVIRLERRAAERHQPAHKLYEATVHAMQRDAPLESALAALKLKDTTPTGERDHRITLGAKMMEIKIDCITMEDKFRVLSAAKAKYGDSAASLSFSGGSPLILTRPFLKSCADFITNCSENALPKLAVEASLYYARIARLFETSGLSNPKDRAMATKYDEKAKTLLEGAEKLCERGFRNANTLLQAVNESLKLLQKEWYEEVTAEELEAIKKAMFAIGECGMPMELARCPECGARIGGRHHEAVQGVTRAENMEH
ncbi:hypothetical protein DL764_002059 [Monosporascus ibericus]|uniref:RZ-type domain-containing protein n=1 Tax=Monosporascus ibericus TaxID=155417 RepID=A0A4Q4TNN5_9PEZI|nr:hypothetical protein DL764_002059 [Monosporascus ibericus]